MTKKDLIAALSAQTGVDAKSTTKIIEALPALIKEQIKEKGAASVHGLGNFSVSERAARTGRNPQTGAALEIAAKKVVTVKLASDLRNAAN